MCGPDWFRMRSYDGLVLNDDILLSLGAEIFHGVNSYKVLRKTMERGIR
jgi:hypothetical protein